LQAVALPEDETKGIARFLFGRLGFPLGLIAVLGAFSLGIAVLHDEVSFSSKRLVLGALLISLSAAASQVPMIYGLTFFDGTKWHRRFRPSALIWTVVFGVATYFLARLLYPMMH
jgi:hypothetical protein